MNIDRDPRWRYIVVEKIIESQSVRSTCIGEDEVVVCIDGSVERDLVLLKELTFGQIDVSRYECDLRLCRDRTFAEAW